MAGLSFRAWMDEYLRGLPAIAGSPLALEFLPQLTAERGKLLSGQPARGIAVYAASFIPQRRIVIEAELLQQPDTLRLCLTHEIFHFVWPRLGNRLRDLYRQVLADEQACHARGEIGESSSVAKSRLPDSAKFPANLPLARHYACESFCDTAAWLYSGVNSHPQFKLAARWRERRKSYFETIPFYRT
jgi:hypothetical protein